MAVERGSFVGGEIRKVSPSALPTSTAMFQNLEGGFIDENAQFRIRDKFRQLSTTINKVTNYHDAKVYTYASYSSYTDPTETIHHNRAIVIQFGTLLSGSAIARDTRYYLVNIETGGLLVSGGLFLPPIEGVPGVNNYFYPEHFDMIGTRESTANITEDAVREFYVFGGRLLFKFRMTDIGITNVSLVPDNTTSNNKISHPYAGTVFGGFIINMCLSINAPRTQAFTDSKAFGTSVAIHEIKAPSTLNQRATNVIAITLIVEHGEVILNATTFSEAVFFITTTGLRALNFVESTAISASNILQRKISVFSGKNVKPRSLYANYLFYPGNDQIRVRDISSLQPSINQAGDKVANPRCTPCEVAESGMLFDEDKILYLSKDRRTFRALSTLVIEGFPMHSFSTFYVHNRNVVNFFTGNSPNWILLSEGDAISGEESPLKLFEYNSLYEPTEESISVSIKTSQFALVTSFNKIKLYIDMEGGTFVEVPGNRYPFNENGKAVLTEERTSGGRRFADPIELKFKTTSTMRVILAEVFYEPIIEG